MCIDELPLRTVVPPDKYQGTMTHFPKHGKESKKVYTMQYLSFSIANIAEKFTQVSKLFASDQNMSASGRYYSKLFFGSFFQVLCSELLVSSQRLVFL